MSPNHKSPLHESAEHESGHLHASGAARYVDDIPPPPGMLVGHVLGSPVAHGKIRGIDIAAAKEVPGVQAVLLAADIPGENDIAPVAHDEPLLAEDSVHSVGQSIALVLADTLSAARKGAAAIKLDIEELPAITTLQQAVEQASFQGEGHTIRRGDPEAALKDAHLVFEGEIETGGQDHFYLESHVALVLPEERDTYMVYSSTQHPSEVQAKVAEVLHLGRHQVVVECPRMGGGFGGKETQAAVFAALAALGAHHSKRPVKIWLNRDQDMVQTGKRHPFLSRYKAALDEQGRLQSLMIKTWSDGGWSMDLSRAILDRYMFHVDNAYYLPNVEIVGRVARTNLVSNTAFRGFGGPQGMVIVEEVLNRAAEELGLDSAEIRRRNYYGDAPRNVTPYGHALDHVRLARIHDELIASSEWSARTQAVDTFNQANTWTKRGIAFQPVKFGISFTHAMLNQAGALVNIYADGTVQVSHGGTEMGQGLHTKIMAIVAHELGVSVDAIRVMNTVTDKVPNTSATAASSGSDLNGAAVKIACETLRSRLASVAAGLLGVPEAADQVRFAGGVAFTDNDGDRRVPFAAVAGAAYVQQVSLSATGYYKTPGIRYDPIAGRGKPFHYYAYGAAVLEVELCGFTGEHRLQRVDILLDVGDSLVPTIDIGQVEGAFIQGLGWLTCEELVWDKAGQLRTHSPDTYKVPAIGEAPPDFRVALLQSAPQPDVVHGSKAVGEPPFMLAIGILGALRQAVQAYGDAPRSDLQVKIPCTPEAVLRAIEDQRASATAVDAKAPAHSLPPT